MNKLQRGLVFGAMAGVIDVLPMVVMKLPMSACLSAFTMWVAIGLLTAISDLSIKGPIKGILVALLLLAPTAILIAAANPTDIIPILIMTLILGGLLGYFVERIRA
jgi:hypothetical protein